MARFISMAALAASGLIAAPAWSLTAAEAWESFRETNAAAGQLTWDSVEDGAGRITARGVVLQGGDDLTSIEVAFGTLIFSGAGEAVRLTMEDRIPVAISTDVEGETGEVRGAVLLSGADVRYSGSPEDLTQTYDIASIQFVIDEVSDMPDGASFDIAMTMARLAGQTRLTGTEATSAAYTLNADSLSYDIAIKDPSEGNLDMDAVLSGISFTGTASLPAGIASLGSTALLANPNYAIDGTFGSDALTLSANFADSTGEGVMELAAGAGDVALSLGNGQVSYDGGLNDLEVAVVAPDLPLPINISMARYGYQLEMPLVATDGDRDMALGVELLGLTLDDFLWNLFDPGAILPRDPADLSFLAQLRGRWLVDIMDPEAASTVGDDVPVEVSSATISKLRLAVAGAELTGEGAFTFDNDDLFTFDGFPAPDGAVDLSLTGGNGLIDKLVQMGLLPQEQAMGARMMMGLFMVPGDGPDSLTSRIEVRPDGQVLANGQRLR